MKKGINIPDDWYGLLKAEFTESYFDSLMQFVEQEYSCGEIFPPKADIFRAFELCPLERLRVVILGQDPYHEPGQANGLAFSVADTVRRPPSLVNILKEVEAEGYTHGGRSGDLSRWADQGVLLLNSVLTVRAHQAASHKDAGWEKFTDAVIREIGRHKSGIVYILWGGYAQRKAAEIDPTKNLILHSAHPSPLSAYRGFLGCGHFAKANQYLDQPIEW